ncbi:hypothetical protein ABPG75_006885 [Micractinium tetrahymenae]
MPAVAVIGAARPAGARQLGAAAAGRRRARAAGRLPPPAASSKPYWEQDNWGVSDSSSQNGNGQHDAGGWDASTSGRHEANGWDADSTRQANGYSTRHDDAYDGGYGYGQPTSSAYRYDSPYDNEPSYDAEPAWRGDESYQQEAVAARAHDRKHLAPGEAAPSYGREDVEEAISSNPLFTPQFMSVLQDSLARQGSSALTSAPPTEPRASASEEVLTAALAQSKQQLQQLLVWRDQLERQIASQQKQVDRIDFALNKVKGDAAYMNALKEMLHGDM